MAYRTLSPAFIGQRTLAFTGQPQQAPKKLNGSPSIPGPRDALVMKGEASVREVKFCSSGLGRGKELKGQELLYGYICKQYL